MPAFRRRYGPADLLQPAGWYTLQPAELHTRKSSKGSRLPFANRNRETSVSWSLFLNELRTLSPRSPDGLALHPKSCSSAAPLVKRNACLVACLMLGRLLDPGSPVDPG